MGKWTQNSLYRPHNNQSFDLGTAPGLEKPSCDSLRVEGQYAFQKAKERGVDCFGVSLADRNCVALRSLIPR